MPEAIASLIKAISGSGNLAIQPFFFELWDLTTENTAKTERRMAETEKKIGLLARVQKIPPPAKINPLSKIFLISVFEIAALLTPQAAVLLAFLPGPTLFQKASPDFSNPPNPTRT